MIFTLLILIYLFDERFPLRTMSVSSVGVNALHYFPTISFTTIYWTCCISIFITLWKFLWNIGKSLDNELTETPLWTLVRPLSKPFLKNLWVKQISEFQWDVKFVFEHVLVENTWIFVLNYLMNLLYLGTNSVFFQN